MELESLSQLETKVKESIKVMHDLREENQRIKDKYRNLNLENKRVLEGKKKRLKEHIEKMLIKANSVKD